MKVVQIKGGNGSGKTTIVKQMMALSHDVVKQEAELFEAGRVVWTTWFRDLGWMAIGDYDLGKAMGGVDRSLPTVNSVKLAIDKAIQHADGRCDIYGIVFEGMMISTIKSTFYDWLLWAEEEYAIEPLFVILEATPHGCLRRIEGRGTKRPGLKFGNLVEKATMVQRHALTYDQKYVRWLDVENTPESVMVYTFLELVGDTELLGWFNSR